MFLYVLVCSGMQVDRDVYFFEPVKNEQLYLICFPELEIVIKHD